MADGGNSDLFYTVAHNVFPLTSLFERSSSDLVLLDREKHDQCNFWFFVFRAGKAKFYFPSVTFITSLRLSFEQLRTKTLATRCKAEEAQQRLKCGLKHRLRNALISSWTQQKSLPICSAKVVLKSGALARESLTASEICSA